MLFEFDERILHADRSLAPGVQLRHCTPDSTLMSVVPPGIHAETDAPIEWVRALDEVPLASLPEAWLARVLRRHNGNAPGRPASEWVKLFRRRYLHGCGETHTTMVSMAGYLVRRLGSGQVALELLLSWNQTHCVPPRPEQEIVELVAWTVRREANR